MALKKIERLKKVKEDKKDINLSKKVSQNKKKTTTKDSETLVKEGEYNVIAKNWEIITYQEEKRKSQKEMIQQYNHVVSSLKLIQDKWKIVPDCSKKENYKIVKAEISKLVWLRNRVEEKRKQLGVDLRDELKRINQGGQDIISQIEAVELKLRAEKEKEDNRIKEEKERLAKIEAARVAAIKSKLDFLSSFLEVPSIIDATSDQIATWIEKLKNIEINSEEFEEFLENAKVLKEDGLSFLDNALKSTKAREEEKARLIAMQKEMELERQKIAQQQAAIEKARLELESQAAEIKAKEELAKKTLAEPESIKEEPLAIQEHESIDSQDDDSGYDNYRNSHILITPSAEYPIGEKSASCECSSSGDNCICTDHSDGCDAKCCKGERTEDNSSNFRTEILAALRECRTLNVITDALMNNKIPHVKFSPKE